MKDINLNNIKVFYEQEYDGGGYRLVDGMFSHPRIAKLCEGKQKVLELCSGPGFFGFYLLGKESRESLHLTDINEDLIPIIRETIIKNDLNNVIFETKFWPSERFDLVVLNPPHHNDINPHKKGEFTGISKLINYDEDWNFHKKFFNELDGHLTDAVIEMTVQQLVGVMKSMPEDSINNAVEDPQRVAAPRQQAPRRQQ